MVQEDIARSKLELWYGRFRSNTKEKNNLNAKDNLTLEKD